MSLRIYATPIIKGNEAKRFNENIRKVERIDFSNSIEKARKILEKANL